MNRMLPILGILIILISCKSTDITNNSEYAIKDESVNLFAFIGEKESVTEFDPNEDNTQIRIDPISGDTVRSVRTVMDNAFNCRYKVIKNVFNKLNTETVEFKAYDHYGRPGFENFENVILYISNSSDSTHYFHQKYQFDPVKKSRNGTWIGLEGESIEELFKNKKKGVFKTWGIFNE